MGLKSKDQNVAFDHHVTNTPKFTHSRKSSTKENLEVGEKPKLIGNEKLEVGFAYIWGSGKDGRCGNGKQSSEGRPFNMNGLQLSKIAAGYHHTAGITKDNIVVTWGRGVFGQLGHGDNENRNIPTPVKGLL